MDKAPRQTLTAPIRRIRFVYVALFLCMDGADRVTPGVAAGSATLGFRASGGAATAEDV